MKRTKEQINEIVDKVVKSAEGNTEGFVLSKMAIKKTIKLTDGFEVDPTTFHINVMMNDFQTKKGFYVNTGNILDALKVKETIHRKAINKWLEVLFNNDEIREMSLDFVKKTGEIRSKEAAKKSAMSQFKAEIDKLTAESDLLGGKILTGGEMQDVKCEAVYNYAENKKTIIRLDTNETVSVDPIPDHERQTEMYDQDGTEIDGDKEVPTAKVDDKPPVGDPEVNSPASDPE